MEDKNAIDNKANDSDVIFSWVSDYIDFSSNKPDPLTLS